MAKKTQITPTALVSQAEVMILRKENSTIVQKAEQFEIALPAQETVAYEVLQEIKARLQLVEKKRKGITQPLNASLKEVNAMFKTLSAPLGAADSILRQKIGVFRHKQEEDARNREEVIRRKAEAEKAKITALEAKKRLTAKDEKVLVKAVERREVLETKAELVQSKVGVASMAKRWTFEVEDSATVPRRYLIVDTIAIRMAIREGVREIPGVRIYQSESVRVL